MSSILDDLDPVEIGQRLYQYRTEAGVSLSNAARELDCTDQHIEALESGVERISPLEILTLATRYHKQLYEVINGPLPYTTPEEVIQALRDAEITECMAASALKVSLLDVRKMVWIAREREENNHGTMD